MRNGLEDYNVFNFLLVESTHVAETNLEISPITIGID